MGIVSFSESAADNNCDSGDTNSAHSLSLSAVCFALALFSESAAGKHCATTFSFSNSGRRLVVDFCVGGEQELRDNTPPVIVAHLASICCCRQPLRAALRADNFVSCHLSRKLDRRHSHVHVVVDIFCPRWCVGTASPSSFDTAVVEHSQSALCCFDLGTPRLDS